jgi:hypothetical protein
MKAQHTIPFAIGTPSLASKQIEAYYKATKTK